MNIQPVSALKVQHSSMQQNKVQTNPQIAFSGNDNSVDRTKLNNALKALTLASAIAFTPALTSCNKGDGIICEDCGHPNHGGDCKYDDPIHGGDNPTDTIKSGVTYVLPEITMPRYTIDENGDTTRLGKVNFSESTVLIPANSHKSAELKAAIEFIKTLGLTTETATKEYVASRSFAYNAVPAQITWGNEKTGAVNQLKLNGYGNENGKVLMDLSTILADGSLNECKWELTASKDNKLLVRVFDKEYKEKIYSMLFAQENGIISQYNVNADGTYSKACEFSKGSGNSVIVTDKTGETSKLANINTVIALAKEEKED